MIVFVVGVFDAAKIYVLLFLLFVQFFWLLFRKGKKEVSKTIYKEIRGRMVWVSCFWTGCLCLLRTRQLSLWSRRKRGEFICQHAFVWWLMFSWGFVLFLFYFCFVFALFLDLAIFNRNAHRHHTLTYVHINIISRITKFL